MENNSLTKEEEKNLLKGYTNPYSTYLSSSYNGPNSTIIEKKFNEKYLEIEGKYSLKIVFNVTEEKHNGYCSDNDGYKHFHEKIKEVEYLVPDSLKKKKFRENGILKKCDKTNALFEPFEVCTCYCGGCINKYEVIEIKYLKN